MGDLCNDRAPAQRAVMGVVPVSRAMMGEMSDPRARAAIGVAPARGIMIGDLTDATVTERASIGVAPARGATIGELTDASLTERVAPAPHAMMGDLSDARVTELSVPVANRTSPESLRSAALGEPGGTLRRQSAHPPPTSVDEGADKYHREQIGAPCGCKGS